MRSSALVASLVAACAVAGCLGASDPAAPTALGRIDGAVLDDFLQPFGNLTVHLVELGRTDTTSALGGFTFRDVPPGAYTLVAQTKGAAADMEHVDVTGSRVTRVILQLERDPVPKPFVTIQKHLGRTDLAVPGQECGSCGWRLDTVARPEKVVARAVWDSTALGHDPLRMTLLDNSGRVLAQAEGTSPLGLEVHGGDVPATGAFELRFTFPEGFHPRPFDMESFLDLHFAAAARPQSA